MRKALVVAPSWIGDTILAQPLFARLHERHPGLVLDAFAPAWAAPVLARMREIRDVIPNPFAHGEFNLAGRWRTAREVAREGYDAAIVLPNSWKSALLPFLAGIPRRIGFRGEARRGLLNRIHALDATALPQLAQRYALLAEEIGAAAPAPLAAPHLEVDGNSVRATLAARTTSLPRRPRSSSARARNTARPSAGRRRISPNSGAVSPRLTFPSGSSAPPGTPPSAPRSNSARMAPAATCAARPTSARPSTCFPARAWW